MKLIESETTLVVAGSWNPAILTPTWIARNVLEYPADKVFQVGVEMPMKAGGGIGSPRLSFEGLVVQFIHGGSLQFGLTPSKADQVEKTRKVARGVCDLLTHTPVSGVGINFTFQLSELGDKLAHRFAINDDVPGFVADAGAAVVGQSFACRVKAKDYILNVDCMHDQAATRIVVNVHFEVSSATAAAEVLGREDVVALAQDGAVRLAAGLCGEALE